VIESSSGGVNIGGIKQAYGNINVGGDVVGGEKRESASTVVGHHAR
jgi:hypothetical protein